MDFQRRDSAAVERFRSLVSLPEASSPKLADAQRAIAREYGLATWSKLKQHMESVTPASNPAEARMAGRRMYEDSRRNAAALGGMARQRSYGP
jgi:hypothetical protein